MPPLTCYTLLCTELSQNVDSFRRSLENTLDFGQAVTLSCARKDLWVLVDVLGTIFEVSCRAPFRLFEYYMTPPVV